MLDNLKNNDEVLAGSEIERKILLRTSQLKVPSTLSKEEAYERLKLKMVETKEIGISTPHTGRRFIWIASAAASVLILFGVWRFLILAGSMNITTPKGQHLEYKLPDGSLVSINAESKLSFNSKKFNKNRFVKLEGEAFFKIQKGKNFVIRTSFADIKVLGTSFNIYARDNYLKVTCLTGMVQVKNGSETVILTQGESATLTNKHLSEFNDKNAEASANWRKGEFNFINSPLNNVFKEIERQFNVTFILPNIENKFYTGDFSNRNLVDALDVVCTPFGLSYEIGTNSKIRIRNKPN